MLGLWWQEKEGARFRLAVLNDLHLRGVKDILIACVDGLTGFPEAISTIYRRPGSRPASCTMPTRRLCRSCWLGVALSAFAADVVGIDAGLWGWWRLAL